MNGVIMTVIMYYCDDFQVQVIAVVHYNKYKQAADKEMLRNTGTVPVKADMVTL